MKMMRFFAHIVTAELNPASPPCIAKAQLSTLERQAITVNLARVCTPYPRALTLRCVGADPVKPGGMMSEEALEEKKNIFHGRMSVDIRGSSTAGGSSRRSLASCNSLRAVSKTLEMQPVSSRTLPTVRFPADSPRVLHVAMSSHSALPCEDTRRNVCVHMLF